MTPTAREIVRLIEEARAAIPNLRVVFKPHLNGHAWLVDTCCCVVYVSGRMEPEPAARAIRDALAVLRAHLDETEWTPLRRAIPEPRHAHEDLAQSG